MLSRAFLFAPSTEQPDQTLALEKNKIRTRSKLDSAHWPLPTAMPSPQRATSRRSNKGSGGRKTEPKEQGKEEEQEKKKLAKDSHRGTPRQDIFSHLTW